MNGLQERLAQELSKTRPLTAQVAAHLTAHHEVSQDEIAHFLQTQLPGLEDYEVDLILSPLFTPWLEDQAIYSEFVYGGPVTETDLAELIARLAATQIEASLEIPETGICKIPLRAVAIDRYVRRLNLQSPIPQNVAECVLTQVPAADRTLAHAIARRVIWQHPGRLEILRNFLAASSSMGPQLKQTLERLLKFVEQYKPDHVKEAIELIPILVKALETEISQGSAPKPFFNERIRELHGYDRDRRGRDDRSISARQEECADLMSIRDIIQGA